MNDKKYDFSDGVHSDTVLLIGNAKFYYSGVMCQFNIFNFFVEKWALEEILIE